MATIDTALALLLFSALVIGVLAYFVIYRHKRELHKVEKESPISEERMSAKEEVEGKRLEPVKRGGRPRTSIEHQEKPREQGTKSRRAKPEIVCWKRERQWTPEVEVPEELLENPRLAVLQDGFPLTQEESREAYWRLKRAFGEVVVRWNEGEDVQETQVALDQENYLLFKLGGQSQNQGRRIKFPTSGPYLVIFPDNWDRDEALSGPPPVASESVSLIGYKAHFFDLEKDGDRRIAFRTRAGESFVIQSKASRFELVGNRLNDASEDIGPLFGERLPQIRALDDQAWNDVRTIVVGKEGSGKGRWRTQFSPDTDRTEQEWPSEVAARKGGWYFLRFYDTKDDLIESSDFRIICALKKIRILQPHPLPTEDGHTSVSVELVHEPGCAVQPADGLTDIQIERHDDKTTLIIPPDPTYGKTRWLVGPEGGPRVEVTILVERLWWAVGDEADTPLEWQDKTITLSRSDFAATSTRALWVGVPRQRWEGEIFVGFNQQNFRPCRLTVGKKSVVIPLREFSDAQELPSLGISTLDLCVRSRGITSMGRLCELTVKVGCRLCDFLAPSEEDIFHHVKSMHTNSFFRLLTYEELRQIIPSLPPEIYKCSYCNFYVKSDDYRNPTSTIYRHVEKECTKVPRGIYPPQVWFSTVNDVDEIRENVIEDLGRIHKCEKCEFRLTEPTQADATRRRLKEEMMRHLLQEHKSVLYDFR